jgi:hypothetical protein
MTPEFRASFPNVFRPSRLDDKSTPSFNLVMLFPKTQDLSVFKKALMDVATARWGEKAPQIAAQLLSPIKSGDAKTYDGYSGMLFIKAANYIHDPQHEHKSKPGLVDAALQPIINPADFYAGCYARATVYAKASGGPGTKHEAKVSFGIRNIQKLRDGEAFGASQVAAEDDFGPAATPSAPKEAGNTMDFLNPAPSNLNFF